MSKDRRITIALLVFTGWVGVTFWSDWFLHVPHEISDSLRTSFVWRIFLAGLLACVAIRAFGWKDIPFALPEPRRAFRILVLPSLYLVIFFILAIVTGLPSLKVAAILALNILAVGFSEEIMFRGILFHALITRLPFKTAFVMTSLLFGATHLLNSLTTGDIQMAAVQALAAVMSGVFLLALVVRTQSLIPAILFHAAWDFMLILGYSNVDTGTSGPPLSGIAMVLSGTALVLPLAIYGVVILRNKDYAKAES